MSTPDPDPDPESDSNSDSPAESPDSEPETESPPEQQQESPASAATGNGQKIGAGNGNGASDGEYLVSRAAADDDGELPEEIPLASLDDTARPQRPKPIHRVNGDESKPSQVALRNLQQNDYDPRRELDRTEVAARADAIERDHGHVHLIVRRLDETADVSDDDQYEIIKGRRDLAALRKLHGENSTWLVDCTVRDVDDRTAMLLMLEAHEWQVEFTKVEQARVYAKLLSVTYGGSEQSLDTYLDDARSAKGEIKLPSNVHSDVEALAEDLRPGPNTIARRLRLLVLPEQAQDLVSAGDLSLRVAEIIVDGLKDLTDPVERREQMLALATSGYDNTSKDELRDQIDIIQQSQTSSDQPAVTEERIEELKQRTKQQENTLQTEVGATINFYNGHDLTTETLDQTGLNQPLDKAESVIDACEDEAERLEPERIDPLIEQKGRLQTARSRTETNLTEREEEPHQSSDTECSYCGGEIRSSDLKTRLKHLDQQIEELDSQISTLRDDRKQFQKRAHKVEDLCEHLDNARSDLERARVQRSESTDGESNTAENSDPESDTPGDNDDAPDSS